MHHYSRDQCCRDNGWIELAQSARFDAHGQITVHCRERWRQMLEAETFCLPPQLNKCDGKQVQSFRIENKGVHELPEHPREDDLRICSIGNVDKQLSAQLQPTQPRSKRGPE